MKLQNLRQADELVDLAMEALVNAYPTESLSEDKIRKATLSLLDNNENLYHTIEVIDDEIVAFMIGHLHEGAFDTRTYATEITGYVKPKYRGGEIADRMRIDFENWAKEKDVDVINIITFSQLERPLRLRGYEAKEKLFYKELK